MPIDTRAAFKDIMANVDSLLGDVDARLATAKVAENTNVSGSVAAIAAAVAETEALAKNAQRKLLEAHREKIARRAEKVKLAQHIAVVASRLLA